MTSQSSDRNIALVRGLGGASLGLGLTEILAPAKVVAMTGMRDSIRTRKILRTFGFREIASGVAVLLGPPQMVWTRVAGDTVDLVLFGKGVADRGPGRRGRSAVSAALLAGITAADVYAALQSGRNTSSGRHAHGPSHRMTRAAVTVRRSPEDIYTFWRDLTQLPTFMYHLKSVTVESSGRSRWVANAPVGRSVQWEAEVIDDVPNQRIAWKSLPGADIDNEGSVEFTPAPDGKSTEVRVLLGYQIPGGALGKAVATLLGESPEQQVNDDLRRFKQIMETGQVMRSDGSPEGTASGRQMHQRPAHPITNGQQDGANR